MSHSGDQGAFFRWAHALVLAEDPRFEPLGTVGDSMRTGIEPLAASVRRSLWHMTLLPSWPEVRAARPLGVVAARPGVDGRYLTDTRSLARLPMLSSHHAGMRTTTVVAPLLVVDARAAFIGAPRGHELAGQVWRTVAPTVVGAAVRCFEATWAGSDAALSPGVDPPFTRRMVDIGFHLADGATDGEISRELGVSARTVSADVAEIVRRLGARNRAHAIALLGGAEY